MATSTVVPSASGPEGALEGGIEPLAGHALADVVAGDRPGRRSSRPRRRSRPASACCSAVKPWILKRRPVGREVALVVGEDLVGPQPLQVVGAHQQREVGERFDEVLVVPALLDHQPGDAQPQRRVGLGPDGDPVVGLGGGGPYSGAMTTIFAPALHALDEPVGVGQLVLDQVLAVHDDELGEAQVVEVAVRGLQAVHPRVPGAWSPCQV